MGLHAFAVHLKDEDIYLVAAHAYVGIAQMLQGRYEAAHDDAERCLIQARKAGLGREMALALFVLSGTLLAREAVGQAQDIAGQSIVVFQEVGQQDEMNWALAAEAYAALALDDQSQAEQSLRVALTLAVGCHAPAALAFTLPAVALWQVARQEPERAVELYAMVSCLPVVESSRWFEDVAGRHIAAAAEALPPDVVAAAQERGRARDLWATARETIAELEESRAIRSHAGR